jgi:uncharacterized protein (TIGR03435 family)
MLMLKKRLFGGATALFIAQIAIQIAFAQAPAAAPAFEVATIKQAPALDPSKIATGQLHLGMNNDAGHVDIGFFSLSDLIRTAYRIKPYQLSGPGWMSDQRWDIQAKIPEGASADQVPEMLQALLAERFKLSIHRSTTDHSIYALIVGKNGSKLKDAEPDPTPAAAADGPPATPPGSPGSRETVIGTGDNQVRIKPNAGGRGAMVTSPKFGNLKISMGDAGVMRMEFSKMKMADLADLLSPFVDRPVLDMTELKGSYQVGLDLTAEDLMKVARSAGMGAMAPGPSVPVATLPLDAASTPTGSVFSAIEKLGLKLDARKAPVEMIVVDHLEKTPTEN